VKCLNLYDDEWAAGLGDRSLGEVSLKGQTSFESVHQACTRTSFSNVVIMVNQGKVAFIKKTQSLATTPIVGS
jgi:hypothetical protein